MDLLDMWSLSYPLLIVAFLEIVVVAWVYGVNKLVLQYYRPILTFFWISYIFLAFIFHVSCLIGDILVFCKCNCNTLMQSLFELKKSKMT